MLNLVKNWPDSLNIKIEKYVDARQPVAIGRLSDSGDLKQKSLTYLYLNVHKSSTV